MSKKANKLRASYERIPGVEPQKTSTFKKLSVWLLVLIGLAVLSYVFKTWRFSEVESNTTS